MFFHRKSRLLASLVLALLLLTLGVTSVFAGGSTTPGTITWKGNGTTNGFCNTVTKDPTVTQGQQRWLFILTSPYKSGPYILTATFSPATNPNPYIVGGTLVPGDGSVHVTVLTVEGAKLISATIT